MSQQGSQRKPADASADALEHKGKWAILSVVSLGTFMTVLDGSIVNIALPSIARAFSMPLNGQIQWVSIAYLITLASSLVIFGKLSGAFGAKRIWLAGVTVFTGFSVACGLAPGILWLIVFRALQGVGAAMIFAPAAEIITDTFPGNQRGRALGINAVVVSLGISVGPILGGLLTEYLDWRWIFFVNAPIGVFTFFWALRTLPGQQRQKVTHFDFVGAVLLVLGLGGLTLGLSFGREWGWSSLPVLIALGVGVGGVAATIFAEARIKNPLINLDLFKNRTFSSAFFSLILAFTAVFAVNFLAPFYFEQLRGFSTVKSGLLLTPIAIAVGVAGPLSGALFDRTSSRFIAPSGLVIVAVGLFLLSRLDASSALWLIITASALVGLGNGTFSPPNTSTLLGVAPSSDRGVASALLATGRSTGQAFGVAITGAVFSGLGGSASGQRVGQGTGSPGLAGTFTHAFDTALLVAAGIAVLAFAVALFRRKQPA